jgi:hypothetical protein
MERTWKKKASLVVVWLDPYRSLCVILCVTLIQILYSIWQLYTVLCKYMLQSNPEIDLTFTIKLSVQNWFRNESFFPSCFFFWHISQKDKKILTISVFMLAYLKFQPLSDLSCYVSEWQVPNKWHKKCLLSAKYA